MSTLGTPSDKAKKLLARADRLKGERSNYDNLCQQIAELVAPRKSEITTQKTLGVDGWTTGLYNQTASHANGILASGQMDYLFAGRWFSFDPPPEIGADDDAKQWYQACTERTLRELARSNWPSVIHEFLLDRSAFGTAAIMAEEGVKKLLVFHKFEIGTYSIEEDHEGLVDTMFREWKLTARQAKQKFGEDNLGPKVKKSANDPKKCDEKFSFVHAIYPREDYDAKKRDAENRPIASCYVCREDNCLVKEDGYYEPAAAVSRYLKWGEQPYGYSPSVEALPTIRQVNFIEMNMDALAEIKAFPRMLVPESQVDFIDMRANGVTGWDPNQSQGQKPETWGTEGEYNVGKERIDVKDKAIRERYHVDLFQMLQQIERQMTAFEVAQRLAEKVTAFSPTFYRLQTEVVTPILSRVFAILYRAGKFPEPPQSVLVPTEGGMFALATPEVTPTSKLAMAIKAAENQAFGQLMGIMSPLAEMRPDLLDNYDLDKVVRGIGLNLGVPEDWQRDIADVEELRGARAEAAAQEQAVALAQGAAKAAKDASAASPEIRKAAMGA